MAPMTKANAIPLTARLARMRVWVQAASLLVWLDPLNYRMHFICSPVFHCYSCPLASFACPIGVLANFAAIHVFPFIAIGTLAIFGVFFGSFICGWVCPFGFLQDLLGRIPTPKLELPSWLGYTRYLVLVGFVVLIPYLLGEDHPLFFCSLCPAGALEAALPNTARLAIAGEALVWPSAAKLTIFLLVTLAMFFTWRPWCTLFCPLGAIYGLCNKVSFFFLRFHPDQCNDCDVCARLCHYHGRSQRRGGETDCVRCLDCTSCSAITVSSVFQKPRAPADKPIESELVSLTVDGSDE